MRRGAAPAVALVWFCRRSRRQGSPADGEGRKPRGALTRMGACLHPGGGSAAGAAAAKGAKRGDRQPWLRRLWRGPVRIPAKWDRFGSRPSTGESIPDAGRGDEEHQQPSGDGVAPDSWKRDEDASHDGQAGVHGAEALGEQDAGSAEPAVPYTPPSGDAQFHHGPVGEHNPPF